MWGRELKLGSLKHFLRPTFRNFQSFRHTSYLSRPGKLQIIFILESSCGSCLVDVFLPGPVLRWPSTLWGGSGRCWPRETTPARERFSRSLFWTISDHESLKLKACERQEHNTWIYISTCLRCLTDENECMWECSHKMTNVTAFAKLGQIGRLRSLLVPLQTVNKQRWSLSGSQGCRGRDESCFFSVSVSTTWLTWRFWRGKRRQRVSRADVWVGCISVWFLRRDDSRPSAHLPNWLFALSLRLSFYFGLTCARQSNTFALSTLMLH